MSDPLDPQTVAEKLAELSQRSARERRRHYARAPKKSADVVGQMFARKGYATPRANEQLRSAWEEAVGAALSKHSRAGSVRRGVLEVLVGSSMMAQELTFEKHRLLKAMQQALPESRIESIRFKVGRIN